MSIDEDLKKTVPLRLLSVKLPIDDDRTTFVACSTYPAIEGKARHHSKITKEEARSRAKEAVGKLLTDFHNNERVVGKIIDSELDKKNRIWIVGAINYDEAGSFALHKMRNGHYNGVSWRMQSFAFQDIDDGDIQVEKHLVNLSVTSNPEYPESKILVVNDDPFPVKQNRALHEFDNALRNRLSELSKKQIVLNTESPPPDVTDNAVWTMNPVVVETPAAVPATPIPAQTEQQQTPPVAAVATPTPQTTSKPVAEPVAVVEQEKKTVEPTTTTTSQPAQQQQQYAQPPVINYNFGFTVPQQNQFPGLSSVPNASSQSAQQQPTPLITPMSTPQTATEKPAETTQPVAAAAAIKQEAAAAQTPAAQQPSFTDELRKSILNEVRTTVADLFKQIPAQQQQPAAQQQQQTPPPQQQQQPPQTEQPKQEEQIQQVNLNALHDTIREIVQLSGQVHDKQLAVDAMASSPAFSSEQRAQKQKEVEDMNQEMFDSMQTLIEGVEKHYDIYTTTLGGPKSLRFADTVARLKAKVAQRQPLSEHEMNMLGWTIEVTSESSNNHRQTLEKAEQQIQAQRQAMQSSSSNSRSFAGKYSQVNQLRQVLSLDPNSMAPPQQRGTKRQFDNNETYPEMARAQEQKKPALSPTEAFQKKTGLPWQLADPSQFPNAPTKPSVGIHVLSQELGIKLVPVPKCQDSIWANGMCNDPSFASLIAEGTQKIQKGLEVYNYTPGIIEYIENNR